MDETTADSTETQYLLEQVHTGDPAAFEQLFARHRDYLRRIIEIRMGQPLRSRFDASDVLQETHLEASERLQEYLARRPAGQFHRQDPETRPARSARTPRIQRAHRVAGGLAPGYSPM